MGNVNKNAKITKDLISTHNETTAKSRIKLLVFGSNAGKSMWFHHTRAANSEAVIGITYRIQSFNIGSKLPEVNAILYDTAESLSFFSTTLTYIPDANGLILTYNTDGRDTLEHLKECMDPILKCKSKKTPILLLGIQESIGLTKGNCVNEAHQFAIDYNLFHLEIDINCQQDLCSDEPYIYLLRTILKQKQTVSSPLMEQTFDFNEDITHKKPWNEVPDELHELGIPELLSKDTDYDAMVRLNSKQNYSEVRVIVEVDEEDSGKIHCNFHCIFSPNHSLSIYQFTNLQSTDSDLFEMDSQFTTNHNFKEMVESPLSPSRRRAIANVDPPNMTRPSLTDVKSHPLLPGMHPPPLRPLVKINSEPALNLQNPMSADDQKQFDHSLHFDVEPEHSNINPLFVDSDDTICRSEFTRFINDELGTERANRYLIRFQNAKLNDIRLLHTVEPLNKQWFERNPLKMDILDKRLLQRAVMKYVLDFNKFKNMLNALGMTMKYHSKMVNRGIATFWGYSYHIKVVKDLYVVVRDKPDAERIFAKMQEMMMGKDGGDISAMNEGAMRQCSQMEGQQSSDSEDMYADGDAMLRHEADGHKSRFTTTSANTDGTTSTSVHTLSPGGSPPPPFFTH